MKGSTNQILIILTTVVGIIAAGLLQAFTQGLIQVPTQYAWLIPLIIVPVMTYIVSLLPKRGTEDLVELGDKIGMAEAVGVLRSYLHTRSQVAPPPPVADVLPSMAEEATSIQPQVPPGIPVPKRERVRPSRAKPRIVDSHGEINGNKS